MSGATTAAVRQTLPLPPPDPALRGLTVALDGDAMAELLSRRLRDGAGGGLEIDSCRPRYIRYKPGTNCLVQYELTLSGADRDSDSTLAHVWLYRDATRKMHSSLENGRPAPGVPLRRPVLLPELNGVLEFYPVDRKLQRLPQAVSPRIVARLLNGAVGAGSGVVTGIDLVRYKPGRKAVIRYGLAGGSRPAVYGRVHADGRGAALLSAGRSFVAAGVPTPAPLGFVSELGLLFVEEASGRRLADLTATEYEARLPLVAEALAAFHSVRVADLPPFVRRNKEGVVLAAARTIATVCPGVAAHALQLGATLASRLSEVPIPATPMHADFYDDQVLVSDAGVVLLDFDAAGLGHPLLDVGNMLAHLGARSGERPRRLFLDAYAAVRPDAVGDLPLFEAAALLRIGITPFRWLRPGWPDEVERRVELAAVCLDRERRRRGRSLASSDAKLPQLELLRDRALMGRELGRLLGQDAVDIEQPSVVRYKPGRRCVLRYDVRPAAGGVGPPETLYGKAFASGRGAQVYERLQAVAAAAACGPGVAIPEPVGYVAPLKLVVQRAVPGVPVAESLLAGDEALAVRLAESVHALHRSEVLLDRRHELPDELEPLVARVERIAAHDERLGERARRCLVLAHLEVGRPWHWRLRPVHRDLYHDQVLVDGDALAILDWDDAAMSEPAVDVANVLGHLRLLSLQRTGRADALEGVASAFEQRYRQLDADLDPELLRLLEGMTLLRLAEIHLPREDGERVAEGLLEQSERLLR